MPECRLSRDFFLWSICVIYLFAFGSLYVQIPGLYGQNGILPARLVVKEPAKTISELFHDQPTLVRVLMGVGFSVETAMDAGYFAVRDGLSMHLHIPFLSKTTQSKLMFASGVVKLTSRCPTWWSLTALDYHFESQCIPTPIAWNFHHLPQWFNKFSVALVYVIEIAIPFLFFSPRKQHQIFSAALQIILQMIIMITGNYNFFNLLTICLCIPLFTESFIDTITCNLLPLKRSYLEDDELEYKRRNFSLLFRRFLAFLSDILVFGGLAYWTTVAFNLKIIVKPTFNIESSVNFDLNGLFRFLRLITPISLWLGGLSLGWTILGAFIESFKMKTFCRKFTSVSCVAFFSILASGLFSVSLVEHTIIDRTSQNNLWNVVRDWHTATRKFQIVNSYGLFRTMTGVGGRPEVILEGAPKRDGPWFEYNFQYKPGNLTKSPPWVAPHQPRLDWQMWFAALGVYEHNAWLLNLVYRLLTNEPTVVQLLDVDPIPKYREQYGDSTPRYIRALLYNYHYSDKNERVYWWSRTLKQIYLPVVGLDDKGFMQYLTEAQIIKTDGSKEKYINTNPIAKFVSSLRELFGQPDGFITLITLFIVVIIVNVIRNRRCN
ncbi:DgyrCDS9313 [Dimorphilus gyrociliatus]|uniref:Lipase maturation factor n=1 Tax=Dimorphilus gyrociliatus TaxID=2664684 RepID=A0A7I8W1U7_9ANNE|nr:DgyrCDS9313 [Dimorphilus gyrociliatus]